MIDDDTIRREFERVATDAPGVRFSPSDVVRHGRRRRRARRGAAVGGAVAALALVVAVPAVVVRGGGGGPPATKAAASTPAAASTTPAASKPAGTSTTPAAGGRPALPPGVTAAQAARITAGCTTSYAGTDPTPRETLRLYNFFDGRALLYGPNTTLTCTVTGSRYDYDSGGNGPTAWLPGPISLDDATTTMTDGTSTRVRSQTFGGRVAAGTTQVRIDSGGRRVVVPVVNGTYLARVDFHPAAPPAPWTITGYDEDSAVVAVLRGTPSGCWTAADGTVVYGDRASDPTCSPATRWP